MLSSFLFLYILGKSINFLALGKGVGFLGTVDLEMGRDILDLCGLVNRFSNCFYVYFYSRLYFFLLQLISIHRLLGLTFLYTRTVFFLLK